MSAFPAILVTDVRFTPAPYADRCTGLLGFAAIVLGNAVLVDGVAVRRTRDGRIRLALPEPTDRKGKRHRPVRLLGDDARDHVEAQVLASLHRQLGGVL